MLTIVQLAWFLAFGAILSAFRDSAALTAPGPDHRYLRSATRARVVLAVIEVSLLLVAIAAAFRLHGADALTRLLGMGGTDAGTLASDRAAPAGIGTVVLALSGLAVAFSGAILTIAAKRTLGKHFTGALGVKEGHALVTHGPYAWVRHPIYLGIILFTLGSGFLFDRGSIVLLAAAITPCLIIQAGFEERIFAEHFGAEYAAYRARVPAVLPWPRP